MRCLTWICSYTEIATINFSNAWLQFGKEGENITQLQTSTTPMQHFWRHHSNNSVPLAWPWVNKWWNQSQYREELSRAFWHLFQNWPTRKKPSNNPSMFDWTTTQIINGHVLSLYCANYVITGTLVLFTVYIEYLGFSGQVQEFWDTAASVSRERQNKKTKIMWHFMEMIFSFHPRAVTLEDFCS